MIETKDKELNDQVALNEELVSSMMLVYLM